MNLGTSIVVHLRQIIAGLLNLAAGEAIVHNNNTISSRLRSKRTGGVTDGSRLSKAIYRRRKEEQAHVTDQQYETYRQEDRANDSREPLPPRDNKEVLLGESPCLTKYAHGE